MKILIVKLSSIGDVVQTLPALVALRRSYPEGRIDWLVEEAASAILTGSPLLGEVITVKRRGWLKHAASNISTARYLAGKSYDMVLDFQGLFKSGVWVWLSRGKRRIGFANGRELSHLFLNEKLPPYDPERHAVDRYMDLAEYAADIETGRRRDVLFPSPPVPVSEADRKRVAGLLQEGGVRAGDPFIVLNPFGRWAAKLWGREKFAELAARTETEFGMKAVIVGSPADASGAALINELSGERALNLAGQTNLKELAQLLQLASIVITVDSGPMHMAVAAGTRVVALFGPTAPTRTGPYGHVHTVVRKDVDCSPCFKRKCDDPFCMERIEVKDVLGAISGQIEVNGRVV